MMGCNDPRAIRVWMRRHASEHIDPKTGECDATGLVEAWDAEFGEGKATLDPNHPAWECASVIAGNYPR